MTRQALESTVLDILCDQEQGMTHVQLVKAFLERGYEYVGNLSEDLHLAVKNLARNGCVVKNIQTRLIRSRLAHA